MTHHGNEMTTRRLGGIHEVACPFELRKGRLVAANGKGALPVYDDTPPQRAPLVKHASQPAACNDNQYTESGDRQARPADRKVAPDVPLAANVTTVRNNSKTALPSRPAMRLVTATMKLSAPYA
jgi:hypothetical protein